MGVPTMRTFFIFIVLVLPAAAAVNSIVHGTLLRKYAQQTPYFRTEQDISRFQKVVARQMYAAVAQMGLLMFPLAFYLLGVVTGNLTPRDLPLVIVPAFVILVLGYLFKKVEVAVRNIPATNKEIERKRDAVVTTWKKRALPDW